MFRLRRYIFSFYCMVVGGGALALHLSLSPPVNPPGGLSSSGVARVVNEMLQVSSDIYTFDGLRRYHTESARASYSPEDGKVFFRQLLMQYYSDDVHAMTLKSDSATSLYEDEVIRFGGEVELLRFGGDGRVQESVTAPNLEIKTDRWIALTQDEVLVRRGGLVARGRGMVADLERGTVKLLENARASHAM